MPCRFSNQSTCFRSSLKRTKKKERKTGKKRGRTKREEKREKRGRKGGGNERGLNASGVWRAQPERVTVTLKRNAKLRRIIAARSRQSRVQQHRAQQATLAACLCGHNHGCTHSGSTTAGQLTRMVTSRVERVASRLSRYEIRFLAEIVARLLTLSYREEVFLATKTCASLLADTFFI